jgi:hypothetical protein
MKEVDVRDIPIDMRESIEVDDRDMVIDTRARTEVDVIEIWR